MSGPLPPPPTTAAITSAPHYLRVTSHGKMSSMVEFALTFLKDHPERPLVLHTLPPHLVPANPPISGRKELSGPQKAQETGETVVTEQNIASAGATTAKGAASSTVEPSKSTKNTLPPSTATIPRLISVAEIIKRAYLSPPNTALVGLHQYNEISYVENIPGHGTSHGSTGDDAAEREEARRAEILSALSGKRHVRIQKTPYMRITLSIAECTEPVAAGASYQPPAKRALSKSGRVRLRRRLNKEKAAEEAKAQEQTTAKDASA